MSDPVARKIGLDVDLASGLHDEGMTPLAISVRGLRKAYGAQVALDDIDFEVPAGTVFALLGPNGSGKSTTVNILCTLIGADSGRVEIVGHNVASSPAAVRGAIGVTGQSSAIDPWLTGRENLRFVADLHHLPRQAGADRAAALLARFGLDEVADRPAMTYSGGMQRRLDLAMTLLGEPQVLFLDEPTTGLDPRSRRDLWDDIRSLVATGVTVLLTTQYLEEADALADRVALLDRGRVVADGTVAELKARIPGGHLEVEFADRGSFEAAVDALSPAASHDDEGLSVRIPSDGTAGSLRRLLESGAVPDDARITLVRPDLDDVFLTLTDATR